MPAHASFLWSQLQQTSALHLQMQVHKSPIQKNGADSHAAAEIRNCVAKIAEMLYLCGGSLFQKSIHDAWANAEDPTADVMLHSIEKYVSALQQHV